MNSWEIVMNLVLKMMDDTNAPRSNSALSSDGQIDPEKVGETFNKILKTIEKD
jgi:hypothetical protein